MLSLSFSSEWSLITGIKADEAGGFVRGRHSRERVKQKRRAFQKEPANRFSLFSPPFSAVRGSSVTTVWLFPTQPDKLLTARVQKRVPFYTPRYSHTQFRFTKSPNACAKLRRSGGGGGYKCTWSKSFSRRQCNNVNSNLFRIKVSSSI